jgi:hypothetical protein
MNIFEEKNHYFSLMIFGLPNLLGHHLEREKKLFLAKVDN